MKKMLMLIGILLVTGLCFADGLSEKKQANYNHLRSQINGLTIVGIPPSNTQTLRLQYNIIRAYTNQAITEYHLNVLIRKLYTGAAVRSIADEIQPYNFNSPAKIAGEKTNRELMDEISLLKGRLDLMEMTGYRWRK